MAALKDAITIALLVLMAACCSTDGAIPTSTMVKISRVNKEGPYLGLVVPNLFELSPLLQSPSFVPNNRLPYLDFGGRRFRFGAVEDKKVIIVMTGLGMINAGTTTQLLLNLFEIKGIIHFGIAGNADSSLQIGDVTVPQYWAHLGLWNWQRYGEGPNDTLSLEANGDYTRQFGHLEFSDYNDPSAKNLLNSVWFQPEEVFPVGGVPETRDHAFWVPVDPQYLKLSQKLEGMIELQRCANATTCLPRSPKLVTVERGSSASIFVDNAAYRGFLKARFNVTPIDMESAAVALVSLQYSSPFIAIRALSDLAGGGPALSNEATVYGALAAQNAVTAVVKFISLCQSGGKSCVF